MDRDTASYYRAILFGDVTNETPIPPTLVLLHAWAFKRFQAMGAGSIISKQAALCVAMTWMGSTKEGREFAREHTTIGELFADDVPAEGSFVPAGATVVDWDSVPVQSKVVVMVDEKPTAGEFLGRRGGWIDIRVGGESKPFRTSQVILSGA